MSAAELAILIANFVQAIKHNNDVGFEDAEKELGEFMDELDQLARVSVPIKTIEGLFWACNMRAEMPGEHFFFSPKGHTFKEFVSKLMARAWHEGQPLEFDYGFNIISYKNKESK